MKCANLKFVPYDPDISPTDNLYDNPNDLDTQPEYPLRTELTYYKQVVQIFEPPFGSEEDAAFGSLRGDTEKYPFPPASTMLSLWFMGLALWCIYFKNAGGKGSRRKKASGLKSV